MVAALVVAMTTACTPSPPLTNQQQVDQIVAFVEATRGHQFVTPPVVQFASEADFKAAILAQITAAEPQVDLDEATFKALGWLAPSGDLYTEYQKTLAGGAVGFYDPATKVLLVRGTDMTPYRREVIAHELTHALDDQLFDLNVSVGSGLLSDDGEAFLVGVEGDAVRTQQAYVATMSPLEQVADIAEQLQLGSDPVLLTIPIAMLSLTQMPYLRGAIFAQQVAIAGGVPAGLDATFARYPSTAEQAFDTTKYFADEGPAAVPTPPADGAVVRSGRFGQFNLTLLLQQGISIDSTINPTTIGWAGDAFVTWTSGTSSCIRLDTAMDTPAQASSLDSALVTWAQDHPGATVGITGNTVRITSCAG
jgi:hypothetical protein